MVQPGGRLGRRPKYTPTLYPPTMDLLTPSRMFDGAGLAELDVGNGARFTALARELAPFFQPGFDLG
jgi:hypothetical protein